MARIRSIKPEFFTSDQLVECSTNARLLFVGMWVFCDDCGRHAVSMKKLKLEVFPGDSFSDDQICGWFNELWRARLIEVYKSKSGVLFFVVSGWHHQKIDRPQPARFPSPNECEPIEYCDDIRRQFDERSTNDRRPFVSDTIRYDTIGYDTYSFEVGHTDSNPLEVPATVGTPFDTVGKTKQWLMPKQLYDSIKAAYPDINISAEFKKAKAWLAANPSKRKTANGMPKFLHGWIGRSQNNGNGKAAKPPPKETSRTMEEIIADDERREREQEQGA